jgi:subtilisin family serine protease
MLRRAALLLAALPLLAAGSAQARTPNDPLAKLQGNLRQIAAPQGWDVARGGAVTVAVVDSGVDLRHPDLRANLWRNPGEIPGNGIDDDGNGIVDDVHGADFVDGDGEPQDRHGHGTHVAGVLGARGGNGIGLAGVAWRVRLMAVRVLDADNAGSTETVARGIDYAVAGGARVVNVSVNSDVDDPALDAALSRAERAGVLVVASAGNLGRDLGRVPSFPVCSPHANVLGVGTAASFANFGGGCVDVQAPGVGVVGTRLGGGYERRDGTSAAAPQVAGAAAVLLARNPRLTVGELTGALRGRLSLAGALRRSA